jgi:hypothetical protein
VKRRLGQRRPAASFVAAGALLAAGTQLAHALGYLVVAPDAETRGHLLAETGHRYLAYAPLFLGICFVIAGGAAVSRAVAAFRGGRSGARTLVPLAAAALPPAGFLIQEHLERALDGAAASPGILLEPAVLVGLLLQLPVALAALLVAVILLSGAEWLGRAVAAAMRPRVPGLFLQLEADAVRVGAPSAAAVLRPPQRGPPS